MTRHARRSIPAMVVAVLLLALCVLVAVALIQRQSGHTPFLPLTSLSHFARGLRLNSTSVLVAAWIAAVLGLLLVVIAVLPGRAATLALTRDEHTRASVGRAGLVRALRATAADVDGVTGATVRVARRRVRVRLRADDVAGPVVAEAEPLLRRRLAAVSLARPAELRLTVAGRRGDRS